MANVVTLGSRVVYSGNEQSVHWEGRVVNNEEQFRSYMQEVVQPRISDVESLFDSTLRGLATTGMATEFLEKLLKALPNPQSWEIGEALAECALRDEMGGQICWPWNTVRDRRTPRASLPGADLVGFYCEEENIFLLIGEVKTSSDTRTPPGVMYGGSGMVWQLENSATSLDIQFALLKWLHARCHLSSYHDIYQKAVTRYLESEGKELLLMGVLIRDTTPNELDLKNRGAALAVQLKDPTRIELIAWYLPLFIADWPALLQEAVS